MVLEFRTILSWSPCSEVGETKTSCPPPNVVEEVEEVGAVERVVLPASLADSRGKETSAKTVIIAAVSAIRNTPCSRLIRLSEDSDCYKLW